MPLLPPPPAISLEQFKEAIKNGKTTVFARRVPPNSFVGVNSSHSSHFFSFPNYYASIQKQIKFFLK